MIQTIDAISAGHKACQLFSESHIISFRGLYIILIYYIITDLYCQQEQIFVYNGEEICSSKIKKSICNADAFLLAVIIHPNMLQIRSQWEAQRR